MRHLLRSTLLAPVRFWSVPVRAEPLALFRICLGFTGLVMILFSVLPRLAQDIGPDGYAPLEANEPWYDRAGKIDLMRGPAHLPYVEGWVPDDFKAAWRARAEDLHFVGWFFAAWCLSLLGVTVGLGTRLSCLAALLLTVSFNNRLVLVTNGGDAVLRLGLFYLLVAPSAAAWSLDRRIWRALAVRMLWRLPQEPPTVPAWGLRLAQIQLCLIYLSTGIYKLDGDWLSGEAVYWMLNDVVITRVAYLDVAVPLWLCKLLTWATLTFEIGFSVAVWVPYLRTLWLLVGVGFHLSILMTMELGWFTPLMLAWYPLFLSGDTCRRLRGGVGRFMRRWR